MMKFSFPEREAESSDYSDRASEDGEPEQKGKRIRSRRNRDSNFYVHIDDVEKMKVTSAVEDISFVNISLIGKSGKEQTFRVYQNTRGSSQSELQRYQRKEFRGLT